MNLNRFVLRGFDSKEEKNEAKEKLEAQGFESCFAMASADFLVVNGTPSSKITKNSKKFDLPMMTLDEALAISGLNSTVELNDEQIQTQDTKPALEISEDFVRILDIKVPRRQSSSLDAGEPAHLDSFSYLCLDRNFLITARNVAAAVNYDIPCVLEGETATAKTTTVLWVAALTGHPVYRLNLNGQTDTSELIGRYVPSSGHVKLDTSTLLANLDEFDNHPDWLRVKQDLLEVRQSISQGKPRELNPVEQARVAKTLGLATKSWEFVEGFIPRALRHGAWVVLDEMNLAEPQILERLNSVLEDDHSLVLTEGTGTTFGPYGSVKVHPEFRLFGTMNPAEYAGRSALSPAFRDRWRLWRFVEQPGEEEFYAMLRVLVFGIQPTFEYKGILYQAPPTKPTYPELQAIEGIDELLLRMATFHHHVSQASGNTGGKAQIGRTRRERYVFTRRGLLTLIKLVHRSTCQNQQYFNDETAFQSLLEDLLTQVYVDRVQSETDRATIRAAMKAAGLMKT